MKYIDTETPVMVLNTIILNSEKNLANYKLSSKFNSVFAESKKKEIDSLKSIINDLIEIQKKFDELKEELFKREAAAIYYGVSVHELNNFISKPINVIEKDIKECISENWRQLPLSFMEGDKLKEIKYANKPVFNYKDFFKK